MDHVVGPLHILLTEKDGRVWFNIISLKLYQFKRNYLVVFVCPGIYRGVYIEFALHFVLKYVMLDFFYKKVIVYRNLCQAHLLEVGLTQIPVDHAPLSTTCHVGLHVDFSSMN